ncbi:hypothetical protein ABIA22_000665 [Sinorhizobium fredii]
MDFKAQSLRRREGDAFGNAVEARLPGEDPASGGLDAGRGLGHQFRRQSFEPDGVGGVLVGMDQHELRGPAIRAQPGLAIVLVRDVQAEDVRSIPVDSLRVDDVDLHVPDGMHDMSHGFLLKF